MALTPIEQALKIGMIVAPKFTTPRVNLINQKRRLVHYTSADNALNILGNREIWLRNAAVMNDSMELRHGHQMMARYFSPDELDKPDSDTRRLYNTMEDVAPGLLFEAFASYNASLPAIAESTYLTCLSEHGDDEDVTGRLSMWRGYGNGMPSVALVINTIAFGQETNDLGAFSSPVIYQSEVEFLEDMRLLTNEIVANKEFLNRVDRSVFLHVLGQTLLAYTVCQKHVGFKEEREWRVMHVKTVHPIGVLSESVESVRGTPPPDRTQAPA